MQMIRENHHMDKTCHSSRDSSSSSSSATTSVTITGSTSINTTTTSSDHFLRHLNKLSHKISKPTTTSAVRPPYEQPEHLRAPPPPPPQQQPPVYNINKSDFRDVVQKLTGSPAHDRIHAPTHPPPIHPPKPASSRLQRIRPPPLAQLSTRPPPLLNCAVPGNPNPLSPLPPLPTCHAAAESPISAHMRFLHSSISAVDVSNNRTVVNPPPPPSTDFPPPSSPLPLGCLPSPKSPCPLLSPNLLFSPTLPGVPSPNWRDL